MNKSLNIISIIFLLSNICLSQNVANIKKVKSNHIIKIQQWDEVLYLLWSDSGDSIKKVEIQNSYSSVRSQKKWYRTGQITKILDSAIVIRTETSISKTHSDTIPIRTFYKLGKYKAGIGQKVIGSLFLIGGLGMITAASQQFANKTINNPSGVLDNTISQGSKAGIGFFLTGIALPLLSISPNNALEIGKENMLSIIKVKK